MRIARIAAIVLLAAACGPSADEIRFAKAQVYHATMEDMLDLAIGAVAPDYKLVPVNKPDCPGEVWIECVWKLSALPAGASEPTETVELHRTGEHRVMLEVDPQDDDQKRADLLLYRIFHIGEKKFIPPPKPAPLPHH